MATAKQKKAAAKNRANAAKALKAAQAKKKAAITAVKSAKKGSKAHKAALAKLAKVKSVATKRASKVKAIGKIIKEKTTEKATTSGSVKHTLTKIKRDDAKAIRDKAVKKMQDLKPGSTAWKKARRNVVTASSNVRKHGNVMRGISGREMGERTSYTGPRQSMRDYIQSIEDSKGGKALTKLNEETKWSKLNKQMLDEMPGKTYAEKRDNWDKKWGKPGDDSYKEMQKIQDQRFKKAYPDADPNVDTDVDDTVDTDTVVTGTGGTGTGGSTVVGTADGGPYSGAGTGGGFGQGRLAARGGYAPGFFGGNPGILNYATPGFLGSEALNPYFSNYENWSQFMPTNYSLAAQGGALYQPGQYWGGARSGLYGTGGVGPVSGGGMYPPGGGGMYPPGGGGMYPPGGGGVTYTPPPGSTYRPPGTTPGGSKYPGVIPGSQKEQDLDAGRTHHPEMYDQNDAWVGAEGTEGGGGTRSAGGYSQGSGGGITGDYSANRTWDNPNYSAGYDSTMGPGAGTRVEWDTSPTAGLLNTQIFDDDPTYWHELTDAQKMHSYADRQNTLDQHKQAVNYMDTGITYGTQANQPTTTTTGYNKQNEMANKMAANQAAAAAAQQAASAASLDDEAMRAWNSMSQAHQAAASTGYREGGGFMGADIGHDEGGYTGGDFSSGEGWE